MNETALREALHEVASVGVGQVDDARLVRVADRAKGGELALTASRGGGRRRWVVGGLAIAAIAVLAVVGVAQALRPVEVTPASGPGSLPDQIFSTREHILTLEQAPIGRVSMLFSTSSLTGDAPPAWIAVGADADEYRWVAPVDPVDPDATGSQTTVAAVSPDGGHIAVGYSGDEGVLLHVEVINASTGAVQDVPLGEVMGPLGGRIDSLSWSPSGERLDVESAVIIKRTSDTGRRWEQRQFMVDGLADDDGDAATYATVQGVRPQGGEELVGWSGESPVVVSYTGRSVTMSDGGSFLSVTQREGALRVVGGSVSRREGTVADVPDDASAHGLSPSGNQFVGLIDPTPSVSGDGDWTLSAFQTSDGRRIWFTEQIPEFGVEIVGWSDDRTPVLFTSIPGKGLNAPTQTQLVEFGPQHASDNGEVLVNLSSGDGDQVERVALAADVLAAGQVRTAEPPHQPWYDPRTLRPTLRDWISEHPYSLFLLLITAAASAALGTLQLSRRRRVARSQSGS
ncbi:MAG: hypothetical protein LH645_08015 [Actinomycetia bacterium]|nr:hypothetical protein [Actinomycetes bacterium]